MGIPFTIGGRQIGKNASISFRDDSEDWQVGDWAECIHRGAWFAGGLTPVPGPQFGDRMIVREVTHWLSDHGPRLMLGFKGSDTRVFAAAGFRKITPLADEHEAATEDVLQLADKAPAPPARELEAA